LLKICDKLFNIGKARNVSIHHFHKLIHINVLFCIVRVTQIFKNTLYIVQYNVIYVTEEIKKNVKTIFKNISL